MAWLYTNAWKYCQAVLLSGGRLRSDHAKYSSLDLLFSAHKRLSAHGLLVQALTWMHWWTSPSGWHAVIPGRCQTSTPLSGVLHVRSESDPARKCLPSSVLPNFCTQASSTMPSSQNAIAIVPCVRTRSSNPCQSTYQPQLNN